RAARARAPNGAVAHRDKARRAHRRSRAAFRRDAGRQLARLAARPHSGARQHRLTRRKGVGLGGAGPLKLLLAATALVHDMILVTEDARLLRIKALRTLAG